MLGSREEAEDAVQHTFAAAYRDLQRRGERDIALKAWLYTIARNRCVSVLRARREQPPRAATTCPRTDSASRWSGARSCASCSPTSASSRRSSAPRCCSPRPAGLSHPEVAEVLGCEVASVKGLVFRARSALIDRRAARDTPCGEIREQLANFAAGRSAATSFDITCATAPAAAPIASEVRRQRQLLAAALPVAPSVGLKSSVMGAAGLGAGAVGGASAGGAGAAGRRRSPRSPSVGVLAGGSVVAGEVAIERAMQRDAAQVAPAADSVRVRHDGVTPGAAHPRVETGGAQGEAISSERNHEQRGEERRTARSQGHAYAGSKARTGGQGQQSSTEGRGLGRERHGAQLPREPRGVGREHGAANRSQSNSPAGGNQPRSRLPVKPVTEATPVMPDPTTTAPTVDDSQTTPPLSEPAPPPVAAE